MDKERIKEITCSFWDPKNGCLYNKDAVIEFLKSIKVKNQDGLSETNHINPREWTSEDWQRYTNIINALASGVGSFNLETGTISCGEFAQGINPHCDNWTCKGRQKYEKFKSEQPDSFHFIDRG